MVERVRTVSAVIRRHRRTRRVHVWRGGPRAATAAFAVFECAVPQCVRAVRRVVEPGTHCRL